MKKLIFAALLLAGSAIVTKAHQEESIRFKVELTVQYDKPVTNGIPVPKSPVTPPDVYLDGHTYKADTIKVGTNVTNLKSAGEFVIKGGKYHSPRRGSDTERRNDNFRKCAI